MIKETNKSNNKTLTVKEILDFNYKTFRAYLTNEQYNRIIEDKKGLQAEQAINNFLDALQESAKLSGQDEDEKHAGINEYLAYWDK